jgi:hypothetical protein
MLIAEGERGIGSGDFGAAKTLFRAALDLGGPSNAGAIGNDAYLQQRLVLATYKSKQPDEMAALREGWDALAALSPDESNDPETVALAGAIEKRLFEKQQDGKHLNRAIGFYRRGYYLRNEWYNGINLAYLLNVRTDTPLDTTDEERIADLVWANRIRQEVLALCGQGLREINERADRSSPLSDALVEEEKASDAERKFWCLATRAEACFGLGAWKDYDSTRRELEETSHADWMLETLDDQIGNLRRLLSKQGHLLNPPWTAER